MNTLRKVAFPVLATVLVFGLIFMLQPDVAAQSIVDGANAARGDGQPSELFGDGGFITTATNILLFIVGVLSVIMLIVGGLRYVISGGNASAVTAAKNTILYAIVGLVIAFLAFAAVNFVLGALTPGSAGFTDL